MHISVVSEYIYLWEYIQTVLTESFFQSITLPDIYLSVCQNHYLSRLKFWAFVNTFTVMPHAGILPVGPVILPQKLNFKHKRTNNIDNNCIYSNSCKLRQTARKVSLQLSDIYRRKLYLCIQWEQPVIWRYRDWYMVKNLSGDRIGSEWVKR
jgi:hypothetical protein